MNILQLIWASKWMMYQPALHTLIEIVERACQDPISIAKAFHGTNYEQYLTSDNQPTKNCLLANMDYPLLKNSYKTRVAGDVAIIPVIGAIFPRGASVPMSYGANVKLDQLNHDFTMALQDNSINTIIPVYDTPGGEVTGISETAQMIFNARSQKQIISYVYGMSASAGIWLSSAGSKTVGSNTSEMGSIGVVASYADTTELEAKKGIKRHEIVSNLSPNKRPDLSTDAGRGAIQAIVDDLAFVFVETMAKHRGVEFKTIMEKYGQGSMFVAKEALERGMLDEISTLDALIKNVQSNNSTFTGGQFMTLEEMKAKDPEGYKKIMSEATTAATAAAEKVTTTKVAAAKEAGKKEGITISEQAQQIVADKEAALKENKAALIKDQGNLAEALNNVGVKGEGSAGKGGEESAEVNEFVKQAAESMNGSRKL